jgi:hypothetical protein
VSEKNELKPWRTERFCIPEKDRARFVAKMEDVLDTYKKAYDSRNVLICMDEASRQLLADVVDPLPMKPGTPKRVDDKYERHGVRALMMFYNPIDGWRRVGCRESRTRIDWAEEVRRLLDEELPEVQQASRIDLRFEGQAVLDTAPSQEAGAVSPTPNSTITCHNSASGVPPGCHL